MKTPMKLIATLATVSILAGCQTQPVNPNSSMAENYAVALDNLAKNIVTGTPAPVAENEKSLKVVPGCMLKKTSNDKDARKFTTHALTYEIEASKNCANSESMFGQRNQYRTNFDSVLKSRKTVIFESDISFTTESKEPFTLFTVHAHQLWCSPPIAVVVEEYQIRITGDWKYKNPISNTDKPWNDYCRKSIVSSSLETMGKEYGDTPISYLEFKRDGTPQKVRFEVHHDGKGNIHAVVNVNGEKIVEGFYGAPDTSIYRNDEAMSHQFGVYSEKYWDYKMKFDNVVFKEVR